MTSEARVAANRRNAAKSTGPRTKQGKAVVAQNALKHGFGAHQDVIPGEDPQQFELLRRRLLGELAPLGEMETLFAERIVSLSWRLQRAQHLQNATLDYLLTREITESLEEFDEFVSEEDIEQMQSDPDTDPRLLVGRVIVRDCLQAKVLDRLMLHERRIEASLSRTLNDLHKTRRLREQEGGHHPTRQGEPAGPTDSPGETKPIDAAGAACSVPVRASREETPDGVTTNEDGDAEQSQSGTVEGGHSPSCETAKQSQSQHVSNVRCQVSGGAGLVPEDKPSCETKPTEAAGSVCSVPARASREETPDGATTNEDGDAEQSQSVTAEGGHSPPCEAAKQSQSEEVSSGAGSAPEDKPLCKTKPMEAAGSAGSVAARACPEPAAGASKGTPGSVTANGADRAKQSQCRKLAVGARALVRPRPRVACRCHDIVRSY